MSSSGVSKADGDDEDDGTFSAGCHVNISSFHFDAAQRIINRMAKPIGIENPKVPSSTALANQTFQYVQFHLACRPPF